MGKKKGRGKKYEEDDVNEEETDETVTGEKKSKKKKKKEFTEDYDEDLSALANELGLDGANSGQEPTGSGVGEPSQHREEINSGGDVSTSKSAEVGLASCITENANSPMETVPMNCKEDEADIDKEKKKKKPEEELSIMKSSVVEVSGTPSGKLPIEEDGADVDEERKKKKKKKKKKPDEEHSVKKSEEHSSVAKSAVEVCGTLGSAMENLPVDEEDEADVDEEKKKKKKKKKKPEEERKSKGPGKAALSRIKKMQAALEEEKLRREQEALAAQRAEEERERARQEKLRLEQERKERQRQKEKERRQRRKAEGKPVTKKEREAAARNEAQMRLLQEQGITLPQKGERSTGEAKKVLYGNRHRNKKEKCGAEDAIKGENADTKEETEETVELSAVSSTVIGESEPPGDGGIESWEDLDVEENMVETTEANVVGPLEEERLAPQPKEEEGNDSETSTEDSSSSSSEEDDEEESIPSFDRAKLRIQKRRMLNEEERSPDVLRSPVVCVLGHVDTGKTKILDKIRRTNVQDGEAGGITQQIGATFVPVDAIREQTKMLKEFSKGEVKLPGLLIIDTPGHESFSNLRTRGSSMCDIAILVVDIMHGLEAQTVESLNLLLKGKTPFIVALNKIDRLFDWHRNPNAGVRDTLKRQKPNTKSQFEERVQQVSLEFAEKGINVALFWDKVDFTDYTPLVPTSAITGDGMGDLIALLVDYSCKRLVSTLMLSMEVEALVMEVKVIGGLGTTIDVILRNGVLKEGDALVMMGNDGPFVAHIRALLMPQPLRELRVKNAYVSHSAVMAAQGVKITAKGDLEKALPGTGILVAKKPDEIDVLKEELASVMKNTLNAIKLQERGVYVQASTLGSLEALLDFLTHSKIPYSGISIGPVHKKDVMKASVMLEHDPQWAVILAFDVRVEREAQEMADNLAVKIFSADIIYHLFDAFLKHREELREKNRQQYETIAVFPCKLRILPDCVFNTRDPIVVGVVVEAGLIKQGTPLTVPSRNFTDIGVVTSMEVNHKPVEMCRKGTEVCLKIEPVGGEAPRLYGRHFDDTDTLISKISRESIDAVKKYFREDLHKADWQLMVELKKIFQIM